MIHIRPNLPYPTDALAPHISDETLEYHSGKHHQTYVDNLNKLILGTPFSEKPLEEIIRTTPPGPVFNNAAQIWNHTFYFEGLAPASGERPTGKLLEAIAITWGSLEGFVGEFDKAALAVFGSGWTWLVKKPDGTLAIVSTSNALTPITGADRPILVCDVWEHAYYIDTRNSRAKYLENFWQVVSWKKAEKRFER